MPGTLSSSELPPQEQSSPASEFTGSDSLDLQLDQPTPAECFAIWSGSAASWRDSLTTTHYIAEAQYLMTVPLARDRGMTNWVLVDKKQRPNQRQVLCSCETYRKLSLISDGEGNVEEGLIHGIASVFCPSKFRGRGYGTRHMKELAKLLDGWQSEYGKTIGSVLYSDIGKNYYTRTGWLPNPRNGHYTLRPVKMERPAMANVIQESELEELCLEDETMIRKAMATPSKTQKRVVVLPNLDHMLWHIRKEDYATSYIFGKKAQVKGVIAGSPGKRVWAIWVRRYYAHPDDAAGKEDDPNVLYILRLVVEGDNTANKPHEGQTPPPVDTFVEQAAALKTVIQAAQAEAAEWRLDEVNLWDPSPLVRNLLEHDDLNAAWVEREEASIACVQWVGEAEDLAPAFINNEYYAWC